MTAERRRIYVASSWRNAAQPTVITALRAAGHQVYDFRNPSVGYDNPTGVTEGFAWSALDPDWLNWTPQHYRALLLGHPVAEIGFQSDWQAMRWADTGVLLLPSGRSAHIKAGYFTGAGKDLHVLVVELPEPELMYRMATSICLNLQELIDRLESRP